MIHENPEAVSLFWVDEQMFNVNCEKKVPKPLGICCDFLAEQDLQKAHAHHHIIQLRNEEEEFTTISS